MNRRLKSRPLRSRVYVSKTIRDEFVRLLVEKTRKIKIGNPLNRDVYLGPVINEEAVKTYLAGKGVAKNLDRIDELIASYAEGWTLERMPAVDRNLARIAVYELLYVPEIDDPDPALMAKLWLAPSFTRTLAMVAGPFVS